MRSSQEWAVTITSKGLVTDKQAETLATKLRIATMRDEVAGTTVFSRHTLRAETVYAAVRAMMRMVWSTGFHSIHRDAISLSVELTEDWYQRSVMELTPEWRGRILNAGGTT